MYGFYIIFMVKKKKKKCLNNIGILCLRFRIFGLRLFVHRTFERQRRPRVVVQPDAVVQLRPLRRRPRRRIEQANALATVRFRVRLVAAVEQAGAGDYDVQGRPPPPPPPPPSDDRRRTAALVPGVAGRRRGQPEDNRRHGRGGRGAHVARGRGHGRLVFLRGSADRRPIRHHRRSLRHDVIITIPIR